jgi:type I restriction enzyme S subunit
MQVQKPAEGYTFLKLNKYSQVILSIIPHDWKVCTVRDITIEHKQGVYTNESYTDDGIKLVRITDLLNPHLSYETMPSLSLDEKTIKEFRVNKGDFLIARSGAIGRFGIANEDIPCVFGSYIIRFVFNPRIVDNNFFGFLFQTPVIKKQLLIIQQGSSNININAENIKSMKVALPDKIEQQRVAYILSKVDELIQKADQTIEQTQRLKEGLMLKLLTKGIGHTKFKKHKWGKYLRNGILTYSVSL